MTPSAHSATAQVTSRLTALTGPHAQQLKQAAWVARCVGRGRHAPLNHTDLTALAGVLRPVEARPGSAVTTAGAASNGVWILREGHAELTVGTGPRQVVVHVLRAGDVDGDVQLLLGMPLPYTTRTLDACTFLHLPAADFSRVLDRHPAIARRWLASIAARLAHSQARLVAQLGATLPQQTARLLLAEAEDGTVPLPQRTLAAMLGVRRPSLNKVLKELEQHDVIQLAYRAIHITDPARLIRLAR
ncbi:Crp/Fnr family transcriptional regulator [Streptomyces sp. NPDC059037]|uniref:Crp/Fnr family transcriptional regulator n=1 Tax=Streptomyces sp. NPDC059037 TaxID=3346710 RepID=UPI0036B3C6DD